MEVRISTKILIIEGDHANFQVRKCIAQALGLLPEVDLLYAPDVSEGLQMMEQKKPDAIIFSEEDSSERELLLDCLDDTHPPLVLQTEDCEYFKTKQNLDQKVMYVPVYDTLEGMHQVLILAASLGRKSRSAGKTY
jgi:hypothetical protein